MKNKGFTLAETLITLVIVGVVAALTVPSMIAQYDREQRETKLKKLYSTLQIATNSAIKDYGPITTWEVKSYNGEHFANKYFIPYLNVAKQGWSICQGSNYDLILTDGTCVDVYPVDDSNGSRVQITVDINGLKKPNKQPKDRFQFDYWLRENGSPTYRLGKLTPYCITHGIRDNAHNYCKKDFWGVSACTALIMKNNWKIPTMQEYVKMGGVASDYPF